MARIHVVIPQDLLDSIEARKGDGVSRGHVIRRLIELGLASYERSPEQAVVRVTMTNTPPVEPHVYPILPNPATSTASPLGSPSPQFKGTIPKTTKKGKRT